MQAKWVLVVMLLLIASAALAVYLRYVQRPATGNNLMPDDEQVIRRGEEIYRLHCAACHGEDLQGQSRWRERKPDGKLPAPPHDDTGHTWHHHDAQLFALTKFGPAAMVEGYKSDMPAYADILSDTEIVAVLSYIKSTWPSKVRDRHDLINKRAGKSMRQ